jgi:hypothetical protein
MDNISTDVTKDVQAIDTAVKARTAELETSVETYEKDLISFVTEHPVLALQFALIVAVPVGLLCYALGKHFHS